MGWHILTNYDGGTASKWERPLTHGLLNNTSTKLKLQRIKLHIEIVNLKPVTPTTILLRAVLGGGTTVVCKPGFQYLYTTGITEPIPGYININVQIWTLWTLKRYSLNRLSIDCVTVHCDHYVNKSQILHVVTGETVVKPGICNRV